MIPRAYEILAISKVQATKNSKKSVLLENDFTFKFHVYFSATFAFYILVSYMTLNQHNDFFFNNETLHFGTNPLLKPSFIKSDVAIATFKNQLKMAVLKEHLEKMNM